MFTLRESNLVISPSRRHKSLRFRALTQNENPPLNNNNNNKNFPRGTLCCHGQRVHVACGKRCGAAQLVCGHSVSGLRGCVWRVRKLEARERRLRLLDGALNRSCARDPLEVVVIDVRAHKRAEGCVGRAT
jgi:hypothetical protein